MNASGTLPASDFDIPVTSLHRDWLEDWAPSIRSPRTRMAIAGNPRLAHRPAASLAAQLGAMPVDEAAIQPADAHAFLVLAQAPSRFLRITGLAALAPMLATIVNGAAVRDLIAEFAADDLRIALSCRDDVKKTGDAEADPDRLMAIVENNGPRMIQEWAASLSPDLRARVRLMLPKSTIASEFDGLEPSVNHNSGRVVRKIAKLLVSPTEAGTYDHGGA